MKLLLTAFFIGLTFASVAQVQTTSYGTEAGNTGGDNSFFGYRAGADVFSTAVHNAIFGSRAMEHLQTGNYNVAVGQSALRDLVSGIGNTGLGALAGYRNNGERNVFLGQYAGYHNATGSFNTMLGRSAGHHSSGSYNVFLGYLAGYYEMGSHKLYIDNTTTSSPLIWGDFSADTLAFNGNVGINGNLTVNGINYTGLIASLSQEVSEKDAEIASLRQEIEAIKRAMHSGTGNNGGITLEGLQPATLGQNAPNPFTGSTTISYELPGTTQQATLYILDMNGRQVMAVDNLTPGRGQAEIAGSALAPGMYFYSLVADGVEVDTKRMLLTK